ncbi:MAG: ABC transporter ATP-binding protein [Caldilineaceae bacterium]
MKICVEELRQTYTGRGIELRTVLTLPHWSVPTGAQVLLRGVSGSGKTTLLNILAGLLPPSAGKVWLDEQMIYDLPEAQRDRLRAQRIGYVFQIHLLVPTLTALENVEMPLVFGGKFSTAQRRQQATALLDAVGLGDFRKHRPVQLSVGQRLRVAVARALVNRPALLLADEPTAALDRTAGDLVMDLIQRLCREAGTTLLVASHDPALEMRFDQVVTLQNGVIVAHSTSKQPQVPANQPQAEV